MMISGVEEIKINGKYHKKDRNKTENNELFIV